MSLTTSAASRAALLTGSSLAVASLSAAVSLGAAALAPSAAMAQATCIAPSAPTSGNGTNAVTYAAGTYNPAIDCTFVGTGATVSTTGAITVSSVAPGGGVQLTATGSNAINWTSTAGAVTGGAQTNGPVIEANSVSGAINIDTVAVTGGNATVTRGILAQSTSGDIDISTIGEVTMGFGTPTTSVGIEARTGGVGDIDITIGDPDTTTQANTTGRLYGILAQTTGSGDLTINAHRGVRSSTAAGAGIHATTASGLLTINLEGSPRLSFFGGGVSASAFGGASGSGIRSNPGADAVINIGVGGAASGLWGIDATVLAGTTTTLNVAGYQVDGNDYANYFPDNDGSVTRLRANGAGDFVGNIQGRLTGLVDFGALTAGSELNFSGEGVWYMQGTTPVFSPGDDLLTTAELGMILTGIRVTSSVADPDHVLDFGAGDDSFENGGYLIVNQGTNQRIGDSPPLPYLDTEGTTRLVNLETFTNTGTVLLGGQFDGTGDQAPNLAFFRVSDLSYDDVLELPGTHWVGAGGQVVFDIDLTGVQANCADRNADGDLGAADCLRIPGGSTEGVTNVTLVETLTGDRGRLNREGIVLVEMEDGTSEQGHFIVGPETRGYNDILGGVLDKGVFMYAIGYDAAAGQHKLVGVPGPSGWQFPLMTTAAQNLWRLSTGSWFERQADLRGGLDDGMGGGVWLRANYEQADRDVVQTSDAVGVSFEIDNTHELKSYAVTGGADLISASGEDMAYVFGVMAGYGHTDMEYDVSLNTGRFDSWTGGLYASLLSGGLFVDAAINANRTTIDDDAPGFQFSPAGTLLTMRAISVGGQVEAGWRFPMMASAFVEPLAGVSYVRTKYDDLEILPDDPLREGVDLEFDDPTSFRAHLGGRVGLDQDYGVVRAQYSLLGKVWNEFEGENTVIVHNRAFPTDAPLPLADDFSGQFNEVAVGASVWAPNGVVSGFLNLGGKFGDDYEAKTGSVGVRVAW